MRYNSIQLHQQLINRARFLYADFSCRSIVKHYKTRDRVTKNNDRCKLDMAIRSVWLPAVDCIQLVINYSLISYEWYNDVFNAIMHYPVQSTSVTSSVFALSETERSHVYMYTVLLSVWLHLKNSVPHGDFIKH